MGHLIRDSDAMTITIGCPDTIDGREGRQVLDDVASVVGAEVTLLSRLPGGLNGGAIRVQSSTTGPTRTPVRSFARSVEPRSRPPPC